LRLVAIQLASIRENYPCKSRWERLKSRLAKEFLQQGLAGKVRFLKYAAGKTLQRIGWRTKSSSRRELPGDFPQTGPCVAVVCNGGMGDLVISSSFLDRFFRECGFPTVHVVLADPQRIKEAEFVFQDSPSVKRVTTQADLDPATTPYDAILKMADFVSCEFMRHDRVRSLAPRLYERLTAAWQFQQPYRGFIDASPSFDGLFATVAARSGLRRLDVLGWLARVPFTQEHQLCLSPKVDAYRCFVKDLDLARRPYITVHNGFDNVALRHVDTVTKAWPETHYVRFVERFKARFPQVLVVQVGAKTSRPIANVDRCLLNTTSLDEAAWILKHSLLHLDGDSGLVHLARALHTRSLVLFGPTNREYFRYPTNENVSSTVCSNCWWTTHHWARCCPRGLREPECMKSIDPADVADLAEKHLSSLPAWALQIEDARRWPAASPNNDSAATVRRTAHAFHEWRSDFVLQVLQSAGRPAEGRRLAILGDPAISPSKLTALGYGPALFVFGSDDADGTDHVLRKDLGGNPAACGKLHRDFGSLHNVPAENEEFGIVVAPSFNARSAFPYFSIKEALRILHEDGILILPFDFSAEQINDNGARGAGAAFFQALGDLGLGDERARSPAGGIVVRKSRSGPRLA
jgi:hypothetical protein